MSSLGSKLLLDHGRRWSLPFDSHHQQGHWMTGALKIDIIRYWALHPLPPTQKALRSRPAAVHKDQGWWPYRTGQWGTILLHITQILYSCTFSKIIRVHKRCGAQEPYGFLYNSSQYGDSLHIQKKCRNTIICWTYHCVVYRLGLPPRLCMRRKANKRFNMESLGVLLK